MSRVPREETQTSMDKYLATPTSQTLEKKRKPNSPLGMTDEWQGMEDSIREHITSSADGTNQLLEALNCKLDLVNATVKGQSDQIQALSDENDNLRSRCNLTEGRVTRLEKVVDDLREDLLQINARSMRDNILFRNIAEVQGEDNKKVIQMLYKFFDVELKIPSGELEKIEIIRAHRIGNKGKYTRAIVAKVNEAGKDLIWKHTKNLKGTNFSVMNQLPRELAERRRQLVPEYKQVKQNRHNVKWVGEKLLLEGKIKEVRHDVIKDINMDVIQITADMKVKRAPSPP
jgi:chromosome segregation ATPase